MLASPAVRAVVAIAMAAVGCGGPRAPGAPPGEPRAPGAPAPAPRCAADDPEGLAACVDAERYRAQLIRVAGERPPGSPHWQAVQRHCDVTLSELGFEVERHAYGTGTNVIGVVRGTQWPEQQVVLGAHYDHIPGCAGADDNASGVAGILEAARVLSSVEHPRSLVIACWDEEERGLVGSRAWADRARQRMEEIVVYFNFDAIAFTDPRPGAQRIPAGFGLLFPAEIAALEAREHRADFITFVADARSERWLEALAVAADRAGLPHAALLVPTLLRRSHVVVDLQRSDHAALWDAGYPAIMITDTAEFRSEAYHCRGRPDVVDGLDVAFATQVVRATTYAAATALRATIVSAPP